MWRERRTLNFSRETSEFRLTHLSGPERSRYVQGMFARIADRYDLMNRVMTAGQDVRWRREVIRRTALPTRGRLLDLGTGTGDLAKEALRSLPDANIVAADFTIEMMLVGRRDPGSARIRWLAGDALCTPFPSQAFDAVVSGFLLRNVIDLTAALMEQYRLLKPGGMIVALDTTQPPDGVFLPLIRFHMRHIIPTLGQLLAGDRMAYTYLPESTEEFLTAEQLAARMALAGFKEVGFRRLMFGTIAIHWGVK